MAKTAPGRDDVHRLVDEQASLRRVATLVAEGAEGAALFSAVAEEVGVVLGASSITIDRYDPDASVVIASLNEPGFPVGSRWPVDGPSVGATVLATGRSARIDDYSGLGGSVAEAIRTWGITSAVGVPIIVGGDVWGVICVSTDGREALPGDTEARLERFTALIATAIANGDARDDLRRLVEEQAALRRVATLAAGGATADEIFDAVVHEVATVTEVEIVSLDRYEGDESVVLAGLNDPAYPTGSRWPLEPGTLAAAIFETGRPARKHDYSELAGTIAAAARANSLTSTVGVPIILDDRVWGIICVAASGGEPLPVDTEAHLFGFTELVATALASIEAREDIRRLAFEQATLRRVATLVAEGATAAELFAAVTEAIGRVLDVASVTLDRYETDATTTVLGAYGVTSFTVGTRWPLDGPSLAATVLETGGPARLDDYSELPGTIAAAMRDGPSISAAAVPIIVDGSVWGVICVGASESELLPPDMETRLRDFTELVATAVSNATTRAELIASRARIVAAGDEARRRIERDLHDGTQQRLVAMALDLQTLHKAISPSEPRTRAGLERMGRDIESVLEEVRELSRGLHPPLLARGGLGPALRALARRSRIHVDLSVDAEQRPPKSIETGVYYVVAEALTNAAKHSQATRIVVDVSTRGPVLRATIEDNGVGGAEPGAGSGLVGLSDRVEALGGTLALESPPGHGTTISIELPQGA